MYTYCPDIILLKTCPALDKKLYGNPKLGHLKTLAFMHIEMGTSGGFDQ